MRLSILVKQAVLSVIFGLFVFGSPCPIWAESGSDLPREKQETWRNIKQKITKEFHVCMEHCGGDRDCLANCKKAYDSRLEKAYRQLMVTENMPEDDIADHPSCSYCGMDRGKFAHSRVLIEYDDGTVFGACSIHCAAVNMAVNIDKAPVRIMVGDYKTRNLIDAENAFWVIGGKKMGVMTKRAKWAFAEGNAAGEFIKANGGKPGDMEAAIKAAYEDMYVDTKMIREKRKMARMMKSGNH